MRIFANLEEAYNEIERELKHNGLKSQSSTVQDKHVEDDANYQMKELIGYSYSIKDTSDRDKWLKDRGCSLQWAKADFLERVTNKPGNPGTAYKYRGDIWNEFLHDGTFSYTYGERLDGKISSVVKLLSENENSRQGVIPIYDSNIDDERRGGIMRVPCSMYYHFIARNGKLDVIYNMRSCDFNTHLPYDLWHAAELRDFIASKLGLQPGELIHQVSSLHAFYKDNKEIF